MLMDSDNWKDSATPEIWSSIIVLDWIIQKHQGVQYILKSVHYYPFH